MGSRYDAKQGIDGIVTLTNDPLAIDNIRKIKAGDRVVCNDDGNSGTVLAVDDDNYGCTVLFDDTLETWIDATDCPKSNFLRRIERVSIRRLEFSLALPHATDLQLPYLHFVALVGAICVLLFVFNELWPDKAKTKIVYLKVPSATIFSDIASEKMMYPALIL